MDPSGHIDDFSAIYSLLDFYSEGMESIYSVIYKPYTEEIMDCKNEIPEAFKELHHALNDNISNKSQSVLIQQFNYHVTSRLINNGILNIMELHKTLVDIRYNSLFEVNFNVYQKTLALTNSLITKNKMLVKAMRDAKVELPKLNCKSKKPDVFKHPEGAAHKAIRQALGGAYFSFHNSQRLQGKMVLGEDSYGHSGDKYFWPLSYSSAKTAQKRMDKLEKAGIRCKLTGYSGGYIEFLGYTPETEALLEKERQEVVIAHQKWQNKQSIL